MDFSDWVGNSVSSNDVITARMVDHFKHTLGDHCFTGNEVPPGLHWCLAPEAVSPELLGPDGHPKRGDFLPEIPYARRMWAGAGWNSMVISRLAIMSKSKAALMISALNQAKAAIYVLLR